MRAHLTHVLLEKKLTIQTDELLRDLSPSLSLEIALHQCRGLIQTMMTSLFQGSDLDTHVEPLFIKTLVTRLRLVVFTEDKEKAQEQAITFIKGYQECIDYGIAPLIPPRRGRMPCSLPPPLTHASATLDVGARPAR